MKILILSVVAFATPSAVSAPPAPIKPLGKTLFIDFTKLVPLQRAIALEHFGVPLNELSSATLTEASDGHAAVLQAILSGKSPIPNMLELDKAIERIHRSKKLGEPHLASYLPTTTSLSAEDVLTSLKDRMNISLPDEDDYITMLMSTTFDLNQLIAHLTRLLGDTGRRDILEDMNKLNFKTMRKLLYRVSFAWSSWVQQTAPSFEAIKPLTGTLNDLERFLETNMADKKEELNELKYLTPSSSIDMKMIERLEKQVGKWEKIMAMPLSPERDKAVNGLYADYISNNMIFTKHRRFSNLAEETLNKDKIGQALLADLTPATMYALDSLYFLSRTSFLRRRLEPKDREFVQQHLRNLLEEELQKIIADK